MTEQKTLKKSKLLLNLAILAFILGVAVQFYNYFTFKKYNWTLVKEEVKFNTIGSKSFELKPNINTTYEMILFYKKLIPENAKGTLLDPDFSYKVNISENDNVIFATENIGHENYSVNLKGTEIVLGKFDLKENVKYTLNIETLTPTGLPHKDIIVSVVTNQEIFKKYFYKAGIYELVFFLMFILSFVFFMAFIILPIEKKN